MMAPRSASDILAWLDQFASRVIFQDLPEGGRQKNRVILQYRPPFSSDTETIGARTITGAVSKGVLRTQVPFYVESRRKSA
ncbi:MAG: hypothetical protein WB992_24880 [Bryobacteraceae bacterium]